MRKSDPAVGPRPGGRIALRASALIPSRLGVTRVVRIMLRGEMTRRM